MLFLKHLLARWTVVLFSLMSLLMMSSSAVPRRLVYKPSATSDCGGEEKVISFLSSSISPDPIQNPGDALLTAEMRVLRNVSLQDVRVKLSLTKLEPRAMRVPCFRRFGSCGYDACQMIRSYPTAICPMFPEPSMCSCELVQGTYHADNAVVSLPRFGPIIRRVMQGNYEGNVTFVTSSNRVLGCLSVQFAIKNQST